MTWAIGSQVFEIRFDKEFLYWDRTGAIAKRLCQRMPSLELSSATPGETILKDGEAQITCRYSYNRASVEQTTPFDDPGGFVPAVEFIFPLLLNTIEVSTITRVGHRLTYRYPFSTLELRDAALRSLLARHRFADGFVEAMKDERLKQKALSTVVVRFEDDKTGYRLELRSGQSTFQLPGGAPAAVLASVPPDEFCILLDVDIFTTAPLPASQLLADELVKSGLKLMNTRILPLFQP